MALPRLVLVLLTGTVLSCSSQSQTNTAPRPSAPTGAAAWHGLWIISGQMETGRQLASGVSAPGAMTQGTLTLDVSGTNVRAVLRLRMPQNRIAELEGVYRDDILVLTGFQETDPARQCRGPIKLRLMNDGSRLTGELEMSESCGNLTHQGRLRGRR